MAITKEGRVVEYAKKRLKEKGCLVRKIAYEMRRGCPDMLVLVPERDWRHWYAEPQTLFIEFKRDETTEPAPHQVAEHRRMRAAGADVRIIGSTEQVDSLINELFPEGV